MLEKNNLVIDILTRASNAQDDDGLSVIAFWMSALEVACLVLKHVFLNFPFAPNQDANTKIDPMRT